MSGAALVAWFLVAALDQDTATLDGPQTLADCWAGLEAEAARSPGDYWCELRNPKEDS